MELVWPAGFFMAGLHWSKEFNQRPRSLKHKFVWHEAGLT